MKRTAFTCIVSLAFAFVAAQDKKWIDKKLNTAANALYMKPHEREMICEINRLRSDPPRYARLFIKMLYNESLQKDTSLSARQYSISTS